ncbi:hypothetical protein QJS66_08690 [Kocuria rhizophila]|nr:hypothetical protein QJS66_08690 [Kocuria rhizophila]
MAIAFRNGLPLEADGVRPVPTRRGLAGLASSGAAGRPRRGRHPRNADGERFMERYAPPSRTSRRATSRPGRWPTRCAGPRPRLPSKDYVLLGPHANWSPRTSTRSSRTSRGSPAPTWARSPTPAGARFPTAHYCMGGIPTDIKGEGLPGLRGHHPGRTPRVRWRACRCTVPHGWAPALPPDINVFGKRAGIFAADTRRPPSWPDPRRRRGPHQAPPDNALQPPRQREGRRHPQGPAGHHGPEHVGVPHGRDHPAGAHGHRRSRGALREHPPSRTRASASTWTCWKPWSWASCWSSPR